MPDVDNQHLLELLLDSWHRNNNILVNLLRAVPKNLLEAKPLDDSPSIAQMFHHIHYVRLIFVSEDAPEFSVELPEKEWVAESNPDRMAEMLNESSKVVRNAVKNKVDTGQAMLVHYDHPILFLQHMIWHEGYHHGQIKLALKRAGHAIGDQDAGRFTWDLWLRKK